MLVEKGAELCLDWWEQETRVWEWWKTTAVTQQPD